MDKQHGERQPSGRVRGAIDRARTGVSEAIGPVFGVAGRARNRAGQIAGQVSGRLPGALGHARSGAQATVTRLQTVPDSGLRMVAAVSVGFAVGLRLSGRRRLAALAGFAPASVIGFAIMSRPHRTRLVPELKQPPL